MLDQDPLRGHNTLETTRRFLLAGISAAAIALSGCGENSSLPSRGQTETAPPTLEGSSIPPAEAEEPPRHEKIKNSKIASQLRIPDEQLPPLKLLAKDGPFQLLITKESVLPIERAPINQLFFVIGTFANQKSSHEIKIPFNTSSKTADYRISPSSKSERIIIFAEPGEFGEHRNWSELNNHSDVGVVLYHYNDPELLTNELIITFLRVLTNIDTERSQDRELVLGSLAYAFRKAMGGTTYEDYLASAKQNNHDNKAMAGLKRVGVISRWDFDTIFLASQGIQRKDIPQGNVPDLSNSPA